MIWLNNVKHCLNQITGAGNQAHMLATLVQKSTWSKDGCTSIEGEPLQDKLREEYGGLFLVGYILTFLGRQGSGFQLQIDGGLRNPRCKRTSWLEDNF